ncbi:unnamed protein product [Miscanthus lutarioriparius]|uniref:Uncharacterized protein n=1 Tax=Miscanthus lutarioriparius TaxID=422564 RepID=A0A811N9U0_9POAL|nr:unnamed protein product [Miscanthus lutarioriparius]
MLRSALRRGGAAARQIALAGEASPRDLLRMRVAERERARRRRRDPGSDEFFVPTPESLAWLDSVSLPMVLTAAAVALFTKLLMMEHEATDQERRERKIKNSHPDQGKVRMLTREEWEEVQEVRPRTPFESKLARSHARIRTGEPVRLISDPTGITATVMAESENEALSPLQRKFDKTDHRLKILFTNLCTNNTEKHRAPSAATI